MGWVLILVGLCTMLASVLVGFIFVVIGVFMIAATRRSKQQLRVSREIAANLNDIRRGQPYAAEKRQTLQVALALGLFIAMIGGFFWFLR